MQYNKRYVRGACDVMLIAMCLWCVPFSCIGERAEGPQTVLQVARLCVRQVHFDRGAPTRHGSPGKHKYKNKMDPIFLHT